MKEDRVAKAIALFKDDTTVPNLLLPPLPMSMALRVSRRCGWLLHSEAV